MDLVADTGYLDRCIVDSPVRLGRCQEAFLVFVRQRSLVLTIVGERVTYLLTYLLTPWRRALLEKLTGSQLVKKFLAFYGARRFITAFTSIRHLSIS